MGKRYIVDSNIIIDFCNGRLPLAGRDLILKIKPQISIVTNIEIFSSKDIREDEFNLLEKFVSISVVYPVTTDLIKATIDIRRHNKTKTPDAIIAATALVNDLTLITRNMKDFSKIDNLKVFNPYED